MRPAVRRALSVGMLGAVGLLFGLWWAFVRAPGPADVCEHIVEVTLRESGGAAMTPESESAVIGQLRERCMQHKLDKIQLRGRVAWARYAKCVMASDDLDGVWRC
ncbi:MAG: hypothetical protein IPN32_10570 [Deltaproteobacteria bacterium]|jgi:hypothetical protein|nr:hypothetical protein [Deltaproteobacteria bacterium]MBK8715177.1 hypothetical protein [Deltaproteobacteria bacterium]